ncbi:Uncharacterised protein [Staphylococcus petrasii]|uniref:Uncharacterized protein n=1 Tax=Staphylococcus petrasii TaxID=1276936 RepID=A0A380G2C8_9STAP|nr:Uncharacterised protein [Staphylococcus petrasii]
MVYIKPKDWHNLYGVMQRRRWEVTETDKRISNVYYTMIDGKYHCLSIDIEVYTEDLKLQMI